MLYQVTLVVASASEPNPTKNNETLTPRFEAADEASCRVLVESWLASSGLVHVGEMTFEVTARPEVTRTDDETPKRRQR